ncbi:MAG: hypothetical protein JJ992_09270 [Planctomycetes bacterium]|nr:hypothetical protein [Planctomycetota bacterium]
MRHWILIAAVIVPTTFLVGCGPAYREQFAEIGPNETAFVIPLEGEALNSQGRLDSLDYLEKAMVVSKRITIPQRKHRTGYAPSSYRWIPEVMVITVDRAPVTREWTAEPDTGTSQANQALEVESLDSINFSLGATITCRIEEQDAPTFLYHFGAQPLKDGEIRDNFGLVYEGRSLSDIVDSNIRSYCQARLSALFGSVSLHEARERKTGFFDDVLNEAKGYFQERGITIDSFGSAKGLYYHNSEVQQGINRRFVTENAIEVAKQEVEAQKNRNAAKIAAAAAKREAAEAFLEEEQAMRLKYALEIQQLHADARRSMAESWGGQMPTNLLPGGSGTSLLLDIK